MKRIFWLLMMLFLGDAAARASVRQQNDVAGKHFPLFRFEKSENPQNLIIPYTKLDKQCRFEEKDPKKIVDFYWLNDRVRPKDTHYLIKSGIRRRLEVIDETKNSVSFRIKRDVKVDSLASLEFKLEVVRTEKPCEVETIASFAKGDSVIVEAVRVETEKTFWPPFRKLLSLTVEGTSVKNGEHIVRRFKI